MIPSTLNEACGSGETTDGRSLFDHVMEVDDNAQTLELHERDKGEDTKNDHERASYSNRKPNRIKIFI